MALMDQFNDDDREQNRIRTARPGVTLAKVTNLNDPDKLGRVKCAFLTANTEAKELDWAYVVTPFASADSGVFFMPNVGDVVLVAFDGGDVRRPFVIGSIWGKQATPPQKLTDGKNENFLIKTPNGSEILFADKKGEEIVTVSTAKGNKVTLDEKAKKIELTDGKSTISMERDSGTVTLDCKSKLVIKVGGAPAMTIDGTAGTIKIESKQSVQVESVQVNIEAKAAATVKANGQLTVESTGLTTVKGSMLKLN